MIMIFQMNIYKFREKPAADSQFFTFLRVAENLINLKPSVYRESPFYPQIFQGQVRP